jgi:nuclear pore complex protein Nup155
MNLLWQYYVKTQQNMRAARILAALAESPDLPKEVPDKLAKRVEYLSLALSNAKSYVPGARSENGEFLRDLEERLEVAQVQLELRQAIAMQAAVGNLPTDQATPMLTTLDNQLLDISDVGFFWSANLASCTTSMPDPSDWTTLFS